ncbi:MAG: hypothetical protein IKQ56_09570 [Lachnospiraceae bacterium]|nr:hypothetical protein [Lachnospiraceae bacterium]
MEEFEKVERLVAKANVTYEDAKKALEESNGDMLDAMIYLEKQGKVKAPSQSSFNTGNSGNDQYKDVADAVHRSEGSNIKSVFKSIGETVGRGIKYTLDNYLVITRNGNEIFRLPLCAAIIILLIGWEILLIIMLISLFFDCRYKIVGKNNAGEVNHIFDQAADLAGKAKEKFTEATEASSDNTEK